LEVAVCGRQALGAEAHARQHAAVNWYYGTTAWQAVNGSVQRVASSMCNGAMPAASEFKVKRVVRG